MPQLIGRFTIIFLIWSGLHQLTAKSAESPKLVEKFAAKSRGERPSRIVLASMILEHFERHTDRYLDAKVDRSLSATSLEGNGRIRFPTDDAKRAAISKHKSSVKALADELEQLQDWATPFYGSMPDERTHDWQPGIGAVGIPRSWQVEITQVLDEESAIGELHREYTSGAGASYQIHTWTIPLMLKGIEFREVTDG